MTAEIIARALGGHKAGANWQCRCPSHPDRVPSLSLKDGDNGRPVFRCHAGCSQTQVLNALRALGLWPVHGEHREWRPQPPKPPRRETDNSIIAARVWRESVDSAGTWAESYLRQRGLRLPSVPEIRCRTLRFDPHCMFPDKQRGPALICAFTPILADVPDDPFDDPLTCAIHRIRGRGGENKAMLGLVAVKAIMISPWWHVHETLHVCEGVEDALGIYNEGAADPDDAHRPIWALGSAGAIRAFPVIQRVQKLVIWADHDESRRSLTDARECAERWTASGRTVVIRYPEQVGADYADR